MPYPTGALYPSESTYLDSSPPSVTIDRLSWADTIAYSHRLAIEAVLVDALGNETDLEIVDGHVSLDAKASIRGHLDLSVAPESALIPSEPTDPLAPYGSEIRVSRGVEYPEGDRELVALGVFRIQDVEVNDEGESLSLLITGLDRASVVVDARFEEPYEVAAGTNYAAAIQETLEAGYPEIECDFISTTLTTPALVAEEGADRWEFCQEMAKAMGCSLYFNGEGVCVLTPIVSFVSGTPDWELVEGDGGVLLSAGRRWTREGAFNRVIATGENLGETDTPSRGIATDENPLSPTYYYGPFGRVPRFYRSEFITTDEQAAGAAAAILAKELGTSQQINFGSVVNPKIQPDAIVRIDRSRAGISSEDHIVDSVEIPLTADGKMSGQTRSTQVV